jgi:hypothetical protein
MRPVPLRMWASEQEATISIAAPLRNRVQSEVPHGIQRLLLRPVAVHSMIGNPSWEARMMRTPLLDGAIHQGDCLFLLGRHGARRRRLRDRSRARTPVRHIHHSEGRKLQSAFRTPCAAVEEVTQPERLLPTLRHTGSIRG